MKKKNNKGKNKAKEILAEIGFDEITDMDISELVHGFDITYMSEPLENSDGKIIRGENHTIIKVNSNIPHKEKHRFTVAHELGHFFLHEKLEAHDENAGTLSWYNIEHHAQRGIQEYEANDFASELLMPEKLFKEFVAGKMFSPKLIKDLSTRFKTSITSVVFRMFALDIAPLLIVFIKDGVVSYWLKSDDLRGWVKNVTKLSPPYDSVAQEYIDANYGFVYSGEEKAQLISRSTWFKMYENQEDNDFYEYCIPTKQYKTIISVIWEA